MSKLTFEGPDFRCNLECDRCSYIKPDGERCKNRVCIGRPLCWIHNKKEYGVRIEETEMGEGYLDGKGLFAVKEFARGDWICPYEGEFLTDICTQSRYPGDRTTPYAVGLGQFFNGYEYVDAACDRGIASVAKTFLRPDGTTEREWLHNAEIAVPDGDFQPWLRAKNDIDPGEEIYVYSGPDYSQPNPYRPDYRTYRSRRTDNRPC